MPARQKREEKKRREAQLRVDLEAHDVVRKEQEREKMRAINAQFAEEADD